MAKFFKNYNQINLEIYKNTIKNLSPEEIEEISIDPKYLGMTHMKDCDFCDNSEDDYTRVTEITLMFGYQICKNCSKKNIGSVYKKNWLISNKYLLTEFFVNEFDKDHILKQDVPYRIQRSDLSFEEGWYIDYFDLMKYVIREDDTEDLLLPFYKSGFTIRTLYKKVYLSDLCRFNSKLHETDLINKFKNLLIKYEKNDSFSEELNRFLK